MSGNPNPYRGTPRIPIPVKPGAPRTTGATPGATAVNGQGKRIGVYGANGQIILNKKRANRQSGGRKTRKQRKTRSRK